MVTYHYILGAILLIIIIFGLMQKSSSSKPYSSKLSQPVVFPQPQPSQRMLEPPKQPRELVYNYQGASTPFPPVGSVLSEKTGYLTY
tara:strand:+ start:94 stop:354 length:261 start_codon:yes stop_codon:yes gene_type:complete